MEKDLKPRDIVVRDSIRNAVIVAMAIGGSTNVTLHAPEIARAAGFADFWKEVMTPEEFNHLSQHVVPVLTDARPYGKYSMVDIDEVGGVQVIVRELLEAGLLNGDVLTCTGETLAAQVERLGGQARRRQGDLSRREALQADRRPARARRQPVAGFLGDPEAGRRRQWPPEQRGDEQGPDYEGGLENNVFRGKARVFEGEQGLLGALDTDPGSFQNNDMIIVRYEGPSGAPGMPEMLDPTSRITALCRERGIVVALMTDARFSGGSVGLVIGHVGPEAALGGPIAFIENGDEIIADLNKNELNCTALLDPATLARRARRNGRRRSTATAASIPIAASRTPACCTARATWPSRRPAAAACIRTARSGCASRARRSGQASCRGTSIGRGCNASPAGLRECSVSLTVRCSDSGDRTAHVPSAAAAGVCRNRRRWQSAA